MSKRITLISNMSQVEINRLVSSVDIKLCKVPYGIDDERRFAIDNLPFHLTIFATNKENQMDLLSLSKRINIPNIKVEINDIKIMSGRDHSYILYFAIAENETLKNLQRQFYHVFPSEKYNPDCFLFHITIHIDKDYNYINLLKNKLQSSFHPFTITFHELALYDYPGELISIIK